MSSDFTTHNVTIVHIEITELQNILQYVVFLSYIITYDSQIFNELQKKITAVIILYQNYYNTYAILISDVQTAAMYLNEKFFLTV